jgi:hypothetical protein
MGVTMFGIPLSVILGVLSGFGINAVGALCTPAGQAVRTLLPPAFQMAARAVSGHDVRTEAAELLSAGKQPAPDKDSADGQADPTPTAKRPAKKR